MYEEKEKGRMKSLNKSPITKPQKKKNLFKISYHREKCRVRVGESTNNRESSETEDAYCGRYSMRKHNG